MEYYARIDDNVHTLPRADQVQVIVEISAAIMRGNPVKGGYHSRMPREELVKVPAAILGAHLRNRRKALHMSQHQLGGGDFSPSYVSAVERGKIRPSLKALYILADRLGEPVTYFLQDEETARTVDVIDEAITAASIALYQGRPEQAIASLSAFAAADMPAEVQVRRSLCLGRAYLQLQRGQEALQECDAALRVADLAGNAQLAAYARLYQGEAYYQQQQVGLALESHRRCLQAISEGAIQDVDYCLRVYESIGRDLMYLGQYKDAVLLEPAARAAAEGASTLSALGASYWQTAQELQEASAPQARQFAQESLAVYKYLDVLGASAQLRSTYGAILNEAGESEAAEKAFIAARTAGERIGNEPVAISASIRLSEIYNHRNSPAEAERLAQEAIAQAGRLGNPAIEGQGLLTLAQLYTAQGRRDEAKQSFAAALAKLELAGAYELLSRAYFRFGQALVSWGETANGSAYLEKAYLQRHTR